MRGIVFLVLSLLVLAAVPAIFQESYTRHLFILAMIYAIVASNWDLSLGYTGIFNFGHMTFFAVGVYTAAIAAKTFGVNPWLTLPLSGATAAITALILAAPLARLKGIYVVLVTFAFSQLLLQLVLSQSQITGGAEGMVRIPPMTLGSYKFIRDFKFGYFYIALTLLTLSSVYLLLLTRSTFGRALLAVRDNEDYANARGISISRMRVLALVASSVFPGVAGGFFAIYLRVASPEVLGFGTLSLVLSMVLIGGTASIIGPIFAAFAIFFATEAMAGIRGMEEMRFIIVAVAMILVLRFAPGGLARVTEQFSLLKKGT